jgi:hypothetical protein
MSVRICLTLPALYSNPFSTRGCTFICSGGSAGAWDIDDDGRFDDERSRDDRQNLRVLPADIPGRAAQSWLSCTPWFSPRRERSSHTGASHPGCMLAVAHRCPGRSHRLSNKKVHRQTMQARKPTGKYACSYLSFGRSLLVLYPRY